MELESKLQPSQLVCLTGAYVFGGLSLYGASVTAVVLAVALAALGGYLASLAVCTGNGACTASYDIFPRGAFAFRTALAALCAFPLISDIISFSFSSASYYSDAKPRVFFVITVAAAVLLSRYIRVAGRLSELVPYLAAITIIVCFFGRYGELFHGASGFGGTASCGSLAVPFALASETVGESGNATPALSVRLGKKTAPRSRIALGCALGAALGGTLYIFISAFSFPHGNIAGTLLVWTAALLRTSSSVFAVRRLCEGRKGEYVLSVFTFFALAGFYCALKLPPDATGPAAVIFNYILLIVSLGLAVPRRAGIRRSA